MVRKCKICGQEMNEGYFIDLGINGEYYCSEDCLNQDYSKEEWETIYDNPNVDCYWTTWGDEDDN